MSGIRMTDSDRLIKLIEQMESQPEITCPRANESESCIGCKYAINKNLCNMSARKVDYLIANGVILPPCKVGETVYYITPDKSQIMSMLVNQIFIDREEKTIGNGDGIYFLFENFGKTVFLTKEEAEQALRERMNNDRQTGRD